MAVMQLHEWLAAGRGRAKALAEYLGITPSVVSKMSTGEKKVPLAQCPYIERFTDGAVSCEELLPEKLEYFDLMRQRSAAALKARPVMTSAAPVGGAHA